METLMQTIKRLSEDDYKALLENIANNKFSKPYIVLEAARYKNLTDTQMIDLLDVNPSTYYTLKSRLNSKVAAILSKKVDNPISVLMDEVTQVPANLYGTNKQVSIRALKELEKQLLEYDLSNELIIVYRTLARLYMYSPDFAHYDRLYNKYVAFSLASSKAENLYYDFIIKAGQYELGRTPEDLEEIESTLRELSNITELYNSHRLFVFFNIVRIYYLFITATSPDALMQKEMEIDKTMQEIKMIFDKYPLDTFYNNIRFIVESLYFEYYQKINNQVRARHYYKQIISELPEISSHHILNFHVVKILESKIGLYLASGDEKVLKETNETLAQTLYIDKDEIYNFVSYQKYLAIVKFYEGDYSASARILNNLRNMVNLKAYWHMEMDCKLFQALQYTLMNEEDLCLQITNSISRYVREEKEGYKNIKIFVKLIKASFKSTELPKKGKKIIALWEAFKAKNTGSEAMLTYLQLDNKLIQKLAER
jgi:hypothetical protein